MADVSLFLIDGRVGVTPSDEVFADILRKKGARVILGVNKAEGKAGDDGALEAWSLGLGEPLRLSAEHGEGMDDLYRMLKPLEGEFAEREAENMPLVDVDLSEEEAETEGTENAHWPTVKKPLQIAVIGRPNAGKSTLINKIIGEDRLLTGPEAGITRDAISVKSDWMGTPVRIFDTAGMRKRAKVVEKLEKLSVADGLRAVRFAEVVVVLLDVDIPFETQDLRIADYAETEGRAVVLAVNKWDLEGEKQEKLAELKEMFERLLPQLRGAPLVTISAKTGRGMDRLHDAIRKAHDVWNRRITTARLNSWLGAMTEAHPPPAPGGHRIRLRYISQVKTRPPGFVIMCSRPDELPDSYKRYLVNGLREHFQMPGTPIRLFFRSQASKNPFKDRKFHTPSRLRKHIGNPVKKD
jgi:GTP-binding protein